MPTCKDPPVHAAHSEIGFPEGESKKTVLISSPIICSFKFPGILSAIVVAHIFRRPGYRGLIGVENKYTDSLGVFALAKLHSDTTHCQTSLCPAACPGVRAHRDEIKRKRPVERARKRESVCVCVCVRARERERGETKSQPDVCNKHA